MLHVSTNPHLVPNMDMNPLSSFIQTLYPFQLEAAPTPWAPRLHHHAPFLHRSQVRRGQIRRLRSGSKGLVDVVAGYLMVIYW